MNVDHARNHSGVAFLHRLKGGVKVLSWEANAG